ncbi:MAG: PDR/VanB family oxidoreductase [Rhizobiaceae bacterium]|nr:PDR/VanB family oxidoreductase [Rhizobiaceae bacterium]
MQMAVSRIARDDAGKFGQVLSDEATAPAGADWLEVVVKDIRKEAEGVLSFELTASDGRPLPAFEPGSHLDVKTPAGFVRQYSLCEQYADSGTYRIAVLKEPAGKGGSTSMHDALHPGDRLTVSAPKNHFKLAPGAAHYLLIAGGIGITPLLPMAQALAQADARFELHYSGRSRSRMAFRDQLDRAEWRSNVHSHVSETGQRADLAAIFSTVPAGTEVYFCGPAPFMDAVHAAAIGAGLGADALHREYFHAAAAVSHSADEAFDLVVASTGKRIRVEAGQAATDAMAACGIDVTTSCEQGVCGTCLTRVLRGVPDHRDWFLTEREREANDVFLPCCSRAKSSELTIDL